MIRRSSIVISVVAFGYAFLYLPIVSVVAYSFNDSRLANVWGGFSLRWYRALLTDEQVLTAAWLSLRIAITSATLAMVLGTAVALALDRLGRFRGRSLLGAMVSAPLVMPEVITGVSLLFLLVSTTQWLGWPGTRGMVTVTIAHVTFAIAYVAVVVRARLSGMSRELEEAAMDLGASPLRAFSEVTLPIIAPALAAGWLLAFTLSLDDLVIASFVSGPGATTLPMLIFSKVKLGVTPEINALAALMIAAVTLGVLVAGFLGLSRFADKQ